MSQPSYPAAASVSSAKRQSMLPSPTVVSRTYTARSRSGRYKRLEFFTWTYTVRGANRVIASSLVSTGFTYERMMFPRSGFAPTFGRSAASRIRSVGSLESA